LAETEEATLWISMLPSAGTVKTLEELVLVALARGSNQDAAKTGAWEIRTADNTKPVARVS